MRLWQRALGAIAVAGATAVLAPAAAMASSTISSMSISPSNASAGATNDNLGLDLGFSNSGTDSPQSLTLTFPPGLLANAAADNGTCLKTSATRSSAPPSLCMVGSGTVTAEGALTLGGLLHTTIPVPISQSVDFYLVAPPKSTDLAGLEVYSPQLSEQLGATGDVYIRPSGSAAGVGATIDLSLPDTLPVTYMGVSYPTVPIQIESIDSTLTDLRNPATCPGGGLPFAATATGYGSGDGPSTASRPLDIDGCSSQAYQPQVSVTAVKDGSDKETALTTNVTEGSTQAPSGAIALSFPTSLFAPNLKALPLLCLNLANRCTTVGSVTAQSPLYPDPLTGSAYLTGTSSGLTLTLVFPEPFPITLVGSVSLETNTAAFTGLPDIPLSQLSVALAGGSQGLFATACRVSSGTATARLTSVSGSATRSDSATFSVSGCPGASSGSGSGSSGGGSGSGGSGSGAWSSTSSSTTSDSNGQTHLVADALRGMSKGRPSLRFTVAVSRHAPMFTRLTVMLPAGLGIRSHRSHHRTVVSGVSVAGARIRSLALSHGHLVITLRRSARRTTVTLGTRTLRESRHLQAEVERKAVRRLRIRVAVRDVKRRTRVLTVTVHRFLS